MILRPEEERDHPAVYHVNELAFGQPAEARLVDALRRGAEFYISLVAEDDGEIVGHIFFSPVRIESGDDFFIALGLAPMAVHPKHQRKGIGSELVRDGLRRCRENGYPVVVVLGHPEFYPRFGFVPSAPLGITSEYDVPEEVFMVAELEPGALAGRSGLVKYRPEFAEL